jgi:hypothetical protein
MYIHRLTMSLLGIWLLALALAGAFSSFGFPGWMLLATLGAVPLIIARQLGREPAPTMSETINDARR